MKEIVPPIIISIVAILCLIIMAVVHEIGSLKAQAIATGNAEYNSTNATFQWIVHTNN